jgi:hypothetical protein
MRRTVRDGDGQSPHSLDQSLRVLVNAGENDSALGDHLDRTIRTGAYCAYAPDPRAPAGWLVD